MNEVVNFDKTQVYAKQTNRTAISQLSLKSDIHSQLKKVSEDLYHIDSLPVKVSNDSYAWGFTDEVLYREAKSSYDSIIAACTLEPRVYRFENTKQRIWDDNDRKNAEEEANNVNIKSSRRKSKRQSATSTKIVKELLRKRQLEEERLKEKSKAETKEDVDGTYLDPFAPPKPWKAEIRFGRTIYVNKETGEIQDTNPGEVWKTKLELLDRLVPRDDGEEGYFYKESDEERRLRSLLQREYEKKLQVEKDRRLKHPTELEQVEDVLFSLVEMVVEEVKEDQRIEKHHKWLMVSRSWHAATRGYKMKRLQLKDNEVSGSKSITDQPYLDLNITYTHQVLAQSVLTDVLKLRELYYLERENTISMSSKLSSTIGRPLRNLSLISLKAFNRAMKLPTLLQPISSAGQDESQDDNSKLADRIASISKSVKRFGDRAKRISTMLLTGGDFKKNRYDIMFEETMDSIDDAKMKEIVSAKKGSSKKHPSHQTNATATSPTPRDTVVKHVPCLQIRFLLQTNPPPLYTLKPQQSFANMVGNALLGGSYSNPPPPPTNNKGDDDDSDDGDKDRIAKKSTRRVAFKQINRHLQSFQHHEFQSKSRQLPAITTLAITNIKPQMIFDTSARTTFEKNLIHDIAKASCLPERNISIEEIRRLDIHDDMIVTATKALVRADEENVRQHEEMKRVAVIEKRYRASLNNGVYDSFFRDDENFQLVKEFYSNYPSSTCLDTLCPEYPNLFRRVLKFNHAEEMITYHPPSPISRRLHYQPHRHGRASSPKKSASPDATYWLVKDIYGISESQLQQIRISQLELHQQEKDLQSRLRELESIREYMSDELTDASYHIRQSLKPMMRRASLGLYSLSVEVKLGLNYMKASALNRIKQLYRPQHEGHHMSTNHPIEVVDLMNDMCDTIIRNVSNGQGDMMSNFIERAIVSTHDPQSLAGIDIVDAEYEEISGKLVRINREKETLRKKELVMIHSSSRRMKKLSSKHHRLEDDIEEDVDDDMSDDEIVDCIDEFEYNRLHRQLSYPIPIVNIMHCLVLAVENVNVTSEYDIYNVYMDMSRRYDDDVDERRIKSTIPTKHQRSNASKMESHTNNNNNQPQEQHACEVVMNIFLDDDAIKLPGLMNLSITDIGHMLDSQYKDKNSMLRNGIITKHVLGIKYQHHHERNRNYDSWESYWIHAIHPTFYGYSSSSKAKLPQSKPYTGIPLKIVNPLDSLSQTSKDLYKALDAKQREYRLAKARVEKRKRQQEAIAKARQLASMEHDDDDHDDNENVAVPPSQLLLLTHAPNQPVTIDYNTIPINPDHDDDEEADDDDELIYEYDKLGKKKLKAVLPKNVFSYHKAPILKSDINKLRKIFNLLDRKYNAMLLDSDVKAHERIVGDNNIPVAIYLAKKRRDEAYNNFVIAKRKYDRKNVASVFDAPVLPKLEFQSLPETTIQEWTKEDNVEKMKELRILRDRAVEVKEVRTHATRIRDQESAARKWMIMKFIEMSSDPITAAKVIHTETAKLDAELPTGSRTISSSIEHGHVASHQKKKSSTLVITEEKRTKQMYNIMNAWMQGISADTFSHPQPHLDTLSQSNRQDSMTIRKTPSLSREASSNVIMHRQSSLQQRNRCQSADQHHVGEVSRIQSLRKVKKNHILQFLDVVKLSIHERDTRELFLSRQHQLQQRLQINARRNQSMINAISKQPSVAEPTTVLRRNSTIVLPNHHHHTDAYHPESQLPHESPEQLTAFEYTPLKRLSTVSMHINESLDRISALDNIHESTEIISTPYSGASMALRKQPSRSHETVGTLSRQSSVNKTSSIDHVSPESHTPVDRKGSSHLIPSSLRRRSSESNKMPNVYAHPSAIIEELNDEGDTLPLIQPGIITHSRSQTAAGKPLTANTIASHHPRRSSLTQTSNGIDHLGVLSSSIVSLNHSNTSSPELFRRASTSSTPSSTASNPRSIPSTHHTDTVSSTPHRLYDQSTHSAIDAINVLYPDNMNHRRASRVDNFYTEDTHHEGQEELLLLEDIKADYDKALKQLDEQVPWNLRLQDDEIETLRSIRWLDQVQSNTIFTECFREFPTEHDTSYSMDELVKFAVVMVKLSPIFDEAFAVIKRNEDDIELIANANKKTVTRDRRASTKTNVMSMDSISKTHRRSSAVPTLDHNISSISETQVPKSSLGALSYELVSNLIDDSNEHHDIDDASIISSLVGYHKNSISITSDQHEHGDDSMDMDDFDEVSCQEIQQYSYAQAHPHKYVVISSLYDSKAFCMICKQREYDAWRMYAEMKEAKYKKLWYAERSLSKNTRLFVMTALVRKEYERRNNIIMMNKSLSYPTYQKLISSSEPQDDHSNHSCYRQSNNIKDLLSLSSESKRSAEKYMDYVHRTRVALSHHDDAEINMASSNQIQRLIVSLPDAVIRSGVGYVYANGKDIIPIPITNTATNIDGNIIDDDDDSMKMHDSLSKNVIHTIPIDICEEIPDHKGQPCFGIMIRVWHLDQQHRGEFLGCIKLSYKDMKKPPKGSRMYHLQSDPRCIAADKLSSIMIQGSLTIRLSPVRLSTIYPFVPISWKMFIISAHNLRTVDATQPINPYCQVLWCGPAERELRNPPTYTLMKRWISIGMTSAIEATNNPTYTVAENNMFAFPPIWMDGPIHSIGSTGRVVNDGGWVSRHMMADDDSISTSKSGDSIKGSESSYSSRSHHSESMHCDDNSDSERSYSIYTDESSYINRPSPRERWHRAVYAITSQGLYHKYIKIEAQQRLDALKYLRDAQEIERQCMMAEDMHMKKFLVDESIIISLPLVEEQNEHYRLFTRTMQNLSNPSKQLARLSFVMGSTLEGGGSKTICYDSTVQKMVELVSIPILYEDDEEELVRHVQVLLGINHPHILKIIDLAFHNIRSYNASGFIANDERMALIVVDRYEGITILDYLRCHPADSPLSSDEFKHILIQIITSLAKLHADGIVHRNIHPDCMILSIPEQKKHWLGNYKVKNKQGALPLTLEMPNTSAMKVKSSRCNSSSTTSNSTAASHNNSLVPSRHGSQHHVIASTNIIPQKAISSSTANTKGSRLKKSSIGMANHSKAHIRIGDYWFMHNPRRAGDVYSSGRADWGCHDTIPPELQASMAHSSSSSSYGAGVTDRADVYAFGLCVYHWATNGKTLVNTANRNILSFEKEIPGRWQGYVKGILRMSLQPNPHHRATAQEILTYLQNFRL